MAALFPELFKAAAVDRAPGVENVLRAGDLPEHARLFDAVTHGGFAAGLDDARTDEQPLFPEGDIAHSGLVFLKVFDLLLRLLAALSRLGQIGPGLEQDRGHAVLVLFEEPEPFGKLGFGPTGILPVKRLGQQRQVLGGVVKVQNEYGQGEIDAGQFPHPRRAVAEEGGFGGSGNAAM